MASATKSSGDMPFIVSTGTKKPDPELRKLIRSHVMKGKNRGRVLRPKYKIIADTGSIIHPSDSTPSSDDVSTDNSPVPAHLVTIPRKVGSDISLTRFADTIEDSTASVIIQFSTIAKRALFPLESCINFDPKEKTLEALAVDAAYLHAMAFSAQAYFDLLRGHRPYDRAAVASPHVIKTLQLLRQRLDAPEHDDRAKFLSSTAAVVLCLTFHAHIMGDHEAARHHMLGLRKIVDIGGGLPVLKQNIKGTIEILRCDIGMALHSGTKPLFFADLAREPYWPYPDFAAYIHDDASLGICSSSATEEPFLQTLDNDLATAWRTTAQFTTLINHATATHRKLPKEVLLDAMASITYRLLHISFPSTSTSTSTSTSLSEAVRLGLLAFSSNIFLQWAGVRLPYTYFPAAYRNSLLNFNLTLEFPVSIPDDDDGTRSTNSLPRLLIWLLTIGSVSVFNDSSDSDVWLKPWLRVNLEVCGVRSWVAMREVLDSFMWVGLVHDMPGKALFDSTVSINLW
ncbi:hypothetical protein K449DRAFT_175142 [Hypoxylon sp. EC38]|nr:hypothetical protein K449DRAFT_175142 [Hypoxylon sp. EC38]